MMENNKLLIIGKVWPEPASSAAGVRMVQLIGLLKESGFDITFATSARQTQYMLQPDKLGVSSQIIELNNPSFDRFIGDLNPAFVIFDRYMTEEQFGWRVAETCPNAIRILNMEDVHCLRLARQRAIETGVEFEPKMLLLDETAFREIASIYRSDLTLVISEAEMALLKETFGIPAFLLHYLPLLWDEKPAPKATNPTFEDRQDFVTIGNFRHPPNLDSVFYLKKEIWPLIRKELPEAKLHVYGAYIPQKAADLNDKSSGFLIRGRAAEVNQVMEQSRVCLAPLRFGAGLKGKIFSALAADTPVVATDIGAEGLYKDSEIPGTICLSPKVFARQAVKLYTDKTYWSTCSETGKMLIQQRFNRSLFADKFTQKLHALQVVFTENREQNFVGSMLQHHSLLSSRYLSKWIVEKNKKPNQM